MTEQRGLGHLQDLRGTRVLCCGDLMLDLYVYGRVERISPEAPIPVMRVDRENAMLGGVGNVARNLSALGGKAHLIALVGADDAGKEVAALMAADPSITESLVIDTTRRTTVKVRYVASGQQLLRADREDAAEPSQAVMEKLQTVFRRALADCQVVVLSDYAKGVLGERLVGSMIADAVAAGKPVIVDPKSRAFGRYRGATLLTPNRRELAVATGLSCDGDEDVTRAARQVIVECGIEAVLVTRSEQGMSLVRRDGAPVHLAARAREVFDVSGACDTVAATLAAALAGGVAIADAAELANAAAGIVVGKVGTATASLEELHDALYLNEVMDAERKVVSLSAAVAQTERWRQRGLRVGFTNGCFDLVHPGHISLLTQARAACDRLVVGLNSDDSVRRLKGKARPIQNEAARATVLASLGAVDLVVLFDDDTPMRLLEALRPDVLVKGADYTLDKVVGGELVRSYGGRVVLADLVAGHSTTRTIAKLTG